VTNPQEIRHEPLYLDSEPEPDPALHPGQNVMTDLEQSMLTPALRGSEAAMRVLCERINGWAAQLAHPETRGEARVRHLARMIAALRAKLLIHERRRDEAEIAGDSHRALLLDRFLQTDSRRLEALLREHREACRGGVRVVQIAAVAIGDQAHVSVGGRTG
jgi:hypothetical protein